MNYQNKFEKQIVYSIEYSDLDNLIEKIYDVEFESAFFQRNDSTLSVSVDGTLSDYDQKDLVEFFSTGIQKYNTLCLLLNDMCRKDMIEPGNYIINICW